jgi:hypothetical protein
VTYLRTLKERQRALAASRLARNELRGAVGEVIDAYQAHPVPALASAAVLGLLLAQLRIGSGVVRTGMRIASGPAWHLIRQYLAI